jgi:hypothetical protein
LGANTTIFVINTIRIGRRIPVFFAVDRIHPLRGRLALRFAESGHVNVLLAQDLMMMMIFRILQKSGF